MKLDAAARWITQKKALSIVWRMAKERGIPRHKAEGLLEVIKGIPTDGSGQIRLDHLQGALANIQDSIRLQDPECLARPRGYKVSQVPDVEEIVKSKEFANQAATIWDSTMENLKWIHEGTPPKLPNYAFRAQSDDGQPPCIICLSGAAGTGKSETTWLSAFIALVHLFMMHDPHLELNHNPGRWIVLVCQGIKQSTTKDSLFDSLQYAVDNSPWFEQYCPRRKDFNEELQWPAQRIKVINLTGQFQAGLGKDIVWGGVTEINEMPVIEKSKRVAHTSKTSLDIGESMWNTLENRIETRFSELSGGFPGKLIADSARTHTGDFTSKLQEKAKNDPRILIIERTLWEAKVHAYPKSEPRFLVELGDDMRPPRIIESIDRAIDKDRVRRVPIRHLKRFEADCEKACMDFIGEPTRAVGRFIGYPEKITIAQKAYVEKMGDARPFKFPEISIHELFGELNPQSPIDWQLLINYDYFDLILDRQAIFTMHCDMSTTGDATGFAFGRVVGSKEVGLAHVFNRDEQVVTEMSDIEAPVYQIDGILRIIARPGEIIDPAFIQALGLELKRLVNMRMGSADWMEATQMLLHWRKEGIVADKWSVDVKPDSYYAYKHALREERLIMMPHEVNDRETRNLKRSALRSKIKIDHPDTPGGSKDCSDAVAACIGVLDVTEGLRYYRKSDKPDTDGPQDGAFGESELEDDEDFSLIRYRRGNVTRGGRGRRVM